MRCKTEQEEPGCLPDPAAQAAGDLRVLVAVRKDCPVRKAGARQMAVQAPAQAAGRTESGLQPSKTGALREGCPRPFCQTEIRGKIIPKRPLEGKRWRKVPAGVIPCVLIPQPQDPLLLKICSRTPRTKDVFGFSPDPAIPHAGVPSPQRITVFGKIHSVHSDYSVKRSSTAGSGFRFTATWARGNCKIVLATAGGSNLI